MEKYIKVKFKETRSNTFSSKSYSYKTDLDVKLDDFAMVDTQFGFALAKVIAVDLLIEETGYDVDKLKEVVCICPTDSFYDKQKKDRQEKLLFQKLEAKIKEAKKQQKLDKTIQELELYKDTEIAKLYLQYTEIVK